MTAPKWATDLVALVSTDHGIQPPSLGWHRSKRRWWTDCSSGRAWPTENRIHVTAGKDRCDQRLVVLHEMAHIICPDHRHSSRFWDTAWRLYRAYKVPIRYAQEREYKYRIEAKRAYARSLK